MYKPTIYRATIYTSPPMYKPITYTQVNCLIKPTRTGRWGYEARGATKIVIKSKWLKFRYPNFFTFPKIHLGTLIVGYLALEVS